MPVVLLVLGFLCACSRAGRDPHVSATPETAAMTREPDPSEAARAEMVARDIAARGITDERVLSAMREVPRHHFVPPELADSAYDDRPLPIGHSQTISQPYIVAFMTEAVRPRPTDRALDVGTGSGYHAAVLSRLVARVDSLDIVCPLADEARHRLRSLGYDNVEVSCGDGWAGKAERAPFDVIVVAAAPEVVPGALLEQLAAGGRMIIPIGPQTFEGQMRHGRSGPRSAAAGAIGAVEHAPEATAEAGAGTTDTASPDGRLIDPWRGVRPSGHQELRLIEKDSAGRVTERTLLAVRFVPMTGRPR